MLPDSKTHVTSKSTQVLIDYVYVYIVYYAIIHTILD